MKIFDVIYTILYTVYSPNIPYIEVILSVKGKTFSRLFIYAGISWSADGGHDCDEYRCIWDQERISPYILG